MRKYGTWETGAKFSYRQNNIYHDFYMYDSTGLSYYYHPFSSDLLHCEYVPAAYMQFTSSEWKKIKWSAGIRLEYSQVQLHSDKEEIHRTSSSDTRINRQSGCSSLKALRPFLCLVSTCSVDLISMAILASPMTISTSFLS